MLNVKNKVKITDLKAINTEKNKVVRPSRPSKKSITSKLNQKIEFHRSLEAFSDCV